MTAPDVPAHNLCDSLAPARGIDVAKHGYIFHLMKKKATQKLCRLLMPIQSIPFGLALPDLVLFDSFSHYLCPRWLFREKQGHRDEKMYRHWGLTVSSWQGLGNDHNRLDSE